MTKIRVFNEDDIPVVAALFGRAFPHHRWPSRAACESYFHEVFFNNPWRNNLGLPSWVAEHRGRIEGFYGVLARPMTFRGRLIRTAVCCDFMVDPDRRHSLTALQLAKANLSGPQELTLADGASDEARRLWVSIGGTAPLLYNLHWTRPLRPARYLVWLLGERGALRRPLMLGARPLGAVADLLATRLVWNRVCREESGLAEDVLDSATMLAHLPAVLDGNALQPVYDERSLAWLLDQAARKMGQGTLRARSVLNSERRMLGWYIYYLQSGGAPSEIVQIVARTGSYECVLRRLLADAWRQGAAALRGRVDPQFVYELSSHHCWLRREAPCTLIHSRDEEIVDAIQQGHAFLSRLEGEWWMRFLSG